MNYSTKLTQLRVCTFKGLQNLPLYVAIRQGFFAAHGLDVDIRYTTGSAAQIAGLAHGDYELIQTAPDNVVLAVSAPTIFGLDSETRIAMVLGGSVGPLSVCAQPQLTTLADLRGAVLGVDNPRSGFALVLRDMLAHDHLLLSRDYEFTISGGTSARLESLKREEVAATLLYAPYDTLADTAGFRRLASSTTYYAAYASLATAGLRDWLEGHPHETTRYIAAILQALRWIYAEANITAVRSVLRDEPALALDAATAAMAHAAFVAPGTGFGVTAPVDDAGLRQVITLRDRYGAGSGPLGRATDYYDRRWYDRAQALGV